MNTKGLSHPASTRCVLELLGDPFPAFFEYEELECKAAEPGGKVIITTPNVSNLNSRVRSLIWGFPSLFDPLPLHADRTKRSAVAWAVLLGPLIVVGRLWQSLRLHRRRPETRQPPEATPGIERDRLRARCLTRMKPDRVASDGRQGGQRRFPGVMPHAPGA